MLTILILSQLFTVAYGYSSDYDINSKKVLLIILNRISLDDLLQFNNISRLVNEGSIGLMNPRGIQKYDGAEGYITINASAKSYANYKTSVFFDINKVRGKREEYIVNTGENILDKNIVNTEINILRAQNNGTTYKTHIGALGDNLNNVGLKTAVFGNSDTNETQIRPSCLIPMNSKGLVDYGNIDDVLFQDSMYPYGVRTDYGKILKEIKGLYADSNTALLVIEEGDLNRLYSYKEKLSDERIAYYRKEILRNVDTFIGKLVELIDKKNTRIILLSPNSTWTKEKVERSLSPVVMWGDNVRKGILISATSKRPGIITNLDIAPSITDYLNAPKDNFTGHTVEMLEQDNNISYITKLNDRVNFISSIRYPILSFYSVLTIITILLGLFFLLLEFKISKKLAQIVNTLFITVLVMPIIFILLSLIYISNLNSYILFLLLFLLIAIIIFVKINTNYRLIIIIGLLYVIISIDIISGGNLIKYSVLGYDPIIGARYYGIGNELVGVLLPTSVLSISFIFMRKNKLYHFIGAFLILLTIVLTSYPAYGANFGGTVSLLAAFLFFIFKLINDSINIKRIAIGLLFFTLFIFTIAFIDAYLTPNPTHLGNLLLRTLENGYVAIYSVIVRKLNMNIRLLSITIWYKVLFTTLMSLIVILLFRRKLISSVVEKNKYLFIGITSSILGTIVGFFMNDSGVLLASISNIFNCITLMYVTIGYVGKT
jgi:hypothetical protein